MSLFGAVWRVDKEVPLSYQNNSNNFYHLTVLFRIFMVFLLSHGSGYKMLSSNFFSILIFIGDCKITRDIRQHFTGNCLINPHSQLIYHQASFLQ
jgi:hypothetical protein